MIKHIKVIYDVSVVIIGWTVVKPVHFVFMNFNVRHFKFILIDFDFHLLDSFHFKFTSVFFILIILPLKFIVPISFFLLLVFLLESITKFIFYR